MTTGKKIEEILSEHQIKFSAESLNKIPSNEHKTAVLRSLKIINVIDVILILVALIVIAESNLVLNFINILAGGIIGFSCWRIFTYRSASAKIRKLV